MPAKEIPWIIDEHTLVKHELLRRYIEPWMVIFFQVQEKYSKPKILIYFDGFCGPGTYFTDDRKQDECCGSPLIVAQVANKYIDEDQTRSVVMHCIDNDRRCIEILTERLLTINKHSQSWQVHHADFDRQIEEVLKNIDSSELHLQPMFYFIDPFGYSGYPMNLLERILKYPRAELFINFNVYDIVRFWELEKNEEKMIALFGSDEFKNVLECSKSEQRYNFFVNLYIKSLRCAGADYVMPFRVNTPYQGTRPRYYLIHASKDWLALKVMKNIMAKQSDAPYRFEAVGLLPDQMSLFEDPNRFILRDLIINYINANYPKKLLFEDIERWAYINTGGISNTIKEVLLELEADDSVRIERKQKQRMNTVTTGALIRILEKYKK